MCVCVCVCEVMHPRERGGRGGGRAAVSSSAMGVILRMHSLIMSLVKKSCSPTPATRRAPSQHLTTHTYRSRPVDACRCLSLSLLPRSLAAYLPQPPSPTPARPPHQANVSSALVP